MNRTKWSRFNFLVESEKHGRLLYNSYTNGLLKLDKTLFEQLREIEVKGVIDDRFFRNYSFCQNVIVYNCPYTNTEQGLFYFILYVKGQLYDSPGNYSFFFPNVKLFTESQSYNTYYNRKVVVDENGFYRLGLHNRTKYRNVNNILLHELITSKSYTKYWSISKDKIEKCKDCEFRYMCLDSRLPEYNTNKGVYYFNTECSYSPYTCEWNIKKIPFLNNN